MKYNYLLEYDDGYSLQEKINEIITKMNFGDATISNYNLEEVLLEMALEDLDTYSFLSPKKVIIIDSIETIKQDENKKDIEHLYKYIDNYSEDNLLFICSRKLNNTLKITKELKKRLEYLKVSLEPIDVLNDNLEGYKIDNKLKNYILELCDNDILKIYNECLKLRDYKALDKVITKEDIDEMVVKKLGDSTNITFELSRCLAKKDKKRALECYQELLDYNVEVLSIIALLSSQFRIMYQVKLLVEDGLNNNDIANTLGEKVFRISKTRELINYFTNKEILDIMIKLSDMDYSIKTSDTNPNILLESFIFNV